MDSNLFRRPVSDNEQLYISMQGLFSSFAISLVVEATGSLEMANLRQAVARASEACPGARLVQVGREWVDSGVAPPVHVIANGLFDGSNFEAIPQLAEKMNPNRGPTSEVVVLALNPSVLVFRIFHGTMDGKGAMLWIENIFRALRGEETRSVRGVDTDLSYLLRQNYHSTRPAIRPKVRTVSGRTRKGSYGVWRKRLTLAGQPGCMVARVAEALTTLGESKSNRFLVPVDLRRHELPGKESASVSCGNLTLPIFLPAERGETWAALHTRLLDRLQRGEELNRKSADLGLLLRMPKWGLRALLRILTGGQALLNRQICGGVISNLGVIDLGALSADGFRAKTLYSLTVQQPFAPFTVAIASNRQTTEVMISCYEHPPLIRHAERVLELLEESLSERQALVDLGHMPAEAWTGATVVGRFEWFVQSTPHASALEAARGTTTYAELGWEVDRIGKELNLRGVGPGSLVGICMNRNPELPAAVLAVLKVGAAFLPLDPAEPLERTLSMLRLSNAGIVLLGDEQASLGLDADGRTTLVVTNIPDRGGRATCSDVSEPGGLAYQMYTSGSTGAPRGVQVEHRSLSHYLGWAEGAYKVGQGARMPLFASIGFDSTLTSLLLPLATGACVRLFPETFHHGVLARIFGDASITHVKLAPAHLAMAEQVSAVPSGAKTLIVGGEALGQALARRTQEWISPRSCIVNEYGPTEATIGCIAHVFSTDIPADHSSVPIGRPIPGTDALLLDGDRRAVSEGEVGELFLTGQCLARGYAGEDAANQAGFVTLADGTAAYKTGDLALRTAGGEFVFCGRADDQLNIRGQRVEPGEVEQVVLDFPGVRQTAFALGQSGSGLFVFYTAQDGLDMTGLQEHCLAKWPGPLRATRLVRLAEMPLTSRGKIDRSMLETAERLVVDRAEEAVGRMGPLEAQVLGIWREVLEFEPEEELGLTDDFYLVGGDSLSMLSMLKEVVNQVIGKDREAALLSRLEWIIKNPTIRSLCDEIERVRIGGSDHL